MSNALMMLMSIGAASRSVISRGVADGCSIFFFASPQARLHLTRNHIKNQTLQPSISRSTMSSFHNTQPRTRCERLTAQNKEALEKGRLKCRPGHGPNAADSSSPLVPDPSSPSYEANTFQRDVAGHIKQQKLQSLDKLQHTYERKRQEAAVRESMRWEQLQANQQAESERMQHIRDAGLKGKQNKSSEHYNIVSLAYHPTREGQQLRVKDEVTRYRAMLRSQNLFNKSHSVSFDIITGQARHNTLAMPAAPQQ